MLKYKIGNVISLPLQKHLCGFKTRLVNFTKEVIEPHPNIVDPEDRYRSRLLNSLLVIYAPTAILIVLFRIISVSQDVTSTIMIAFFGLAVVSTIYILGRMGHYRASIYAAIGLGYLIIYANAARSVAPHLEITYLIFVPLLGIVLFKMREALLNYLITIILLLIFLTCMQDIRSDIAADLFVFLILAQGLILFATFQRDRLDKSRHALAVEREQARLVKQLVDTVSHDFKTPLSIIQTSIYLIRHIDTPEKREQGLIRIEEQTRRLEKMIQDLLTISTLDNTVPDYTSVDLVKIVKSVQHQLASVADAKKIILYQEIASDTFIINGYSEELIRMIFNLTENAINYTAEGGQVTTSLARMDANHICLDIIDTGIGMMDEDIPHIFEQFYRADKARSTHTGGSGLGLAIVKRIVERHSGTITVKSQLNVGSTFSVVLPTS